ncbi:MAG: HDOD domain-containing protein [Gammaproteobacteria bacterium]|nr:HDOD domain-containing protein [Gammaproteobacteria bacterium]
MTTQAELLKMVERMPAFPQGVTRVLELTARADCSPKELVKVIEHDPVMTMKILKLVNSAFFGLARPINSINHGVVYVGINTIKNLALTIAAIGMLPQRNAAGFDMNRFLMHSLGVAGISKKLASILKVADKDAADYFIAGLLHDFGKVALAQYKPLEFRQALELAADGEMTLAAAEQQVMGLDHAEIGALLAENWTLPAQLADCIRHHHNPEAKVADAKMRDAVFAANLVVHSVPFGNSGNHRLEDFPPSVQERFGCDLDGMLMMESLGDLDAEMQKATSFMKL